MNEFGRRLKKYRSLKEYTQDELATLLGTDKRRISNWENGVCEPNIDTIVKIANVLDTTTDKLLGNDNGMDPFDREDILKLVQMIKAAPEEKQAKIIELCKATVEIFR